MTDGKKRQKPTMADSPTGVIPRPRFEDWPSQLKEPPQPPPTLPEMDVDETTTGVISVQAEGEDAAKHADDGPTKSATHS